MTRLAAVSLVERGIDGRILVVWNKRYGCWLMPGGLVEEGETPGIAQARELCEETSLETVTSEFVFYGEHNGNNKTRASEVYLYRVTTRGTAKEVEMGCPVTWFTREEFLQWSPMVRQLYQRAFETIEGQGRARAAAMYSVSDWLRVGR